MGIYIVPAAEGKSEYIEKRSSFLGSVKRVESEEEARSYIAQIKKEHRDARHNCWCYIIRNGPERYSDDGEPQGTAGIPMLELFRKENVTNMVCVVTRYFGGILLGTGGLFRAYTKAAKDALDNAGTEQVNPHLSFSLACPYAMAEKIKTEFAPFGASIQNTEYGENVVMTVSVPEQNAEHFSARIFDASNGTVTAEPLKTADPLLQI